MEGLVGRETLLASALDEAQRTNGVLLIGPAGVGKSAVGDAVAGSLATDGFHIETVRCSAMTASIPFAPLMHLQAPNASMDPTEASRTLVDTIVANAADRPIAISVDDLAHSDPGTATVVFTLLVHHDATIVASCRTEEVNAPAVQTLWKDGLLRRIDVEPLDGPASADLVAAITGTAPAPSLVAELFDRAAGNPLYTLALARVGVSSGAIQEDGAQSILARPLPPSAEIDDLLRSQIDALEPEMQDMLDHIALGENLPVETFGPIEWQRSAQQLVDVGLVVIDRATSHLATRCAHPLIGDYVRSTVPQQRKHDIHQRLVEQIASKPDAAPLDVLRATKLAIESDVEASSELLLDGAQVALNVFEFEAARAAAERVIASDPSPRAHLLCGTALVSLGQRDAAEAQLIAADVDDVAPIMTAEVALARANLATFLDLDPTAAESHLRSAFATLDPGDAKALVGSSLAWPLALATRWDESVAISQEVASYPDLSPTIEVQVVANLAMGCFMTARLAELEPVLDRGLSLVEASGGQSSLAALQLKTGDLVLTASRGNLSEAVAKAQGMANLYVASRNTGGVFAAVSSFVVSIQDMTGDMEDAIIHASVAREETAHSDILAVRPVATAVCAMLRAQRGEFDLAREVVADVDPTMVAFDPRSALIKAWADGWIATEGDPATGAAIVADAGETGRNFGMRYWSWPILHSAVRFGHPELVVESLRDEALRSPCRTIELMANHASATADRDVDALTATADAFLDIGAWAYGAEALTSSAAISADAGNEALANRLAVRASLAVDRCRGAQSPLLNALTNPLSEPEFEVARMAASGATSKAIAEARFVSPRTVDNQLRAVYRKLGMNSRSELADVFGPKVS